MDEQARCRFSNLLFEALEQQGYSSIRIKQRSKALATLWEGFPECTCIVAGSAGEGISKVLSGDIDVILVADEMC